MAYSSGSGRSALISWMHAASGCRSPAGRMAPPGRTRSPSPGDRMGLVAATMTGSPTDREDASVTGHTYEVRVAGKLGPSAREAFADVVIEVEPTSTVLSAQLDQPGLHALL